MASASIQKARVIENSAAVLMARVQKDSGANIVQGDLSAIACKVFNADDNSEVATPTLTIAGTVFNSLQTDARWTADSTGYNFAAALAGTNWPTAGNYRVEIKLTPGSGSPFYLLWDLQALNIHSE